MLADLEDEIRARRVAEELVKAGAEKDHERAHAKR